LVLVSRTGAGAEVWFSRVLLASQGNGLVLLLGKGIGGIPSYQGLGIHTCHVAGVKAGDDYSPAVVVRDGESKALVASSISEGVEAQETQVLELEA
jgi:hypothetical protein